VLWVLEYATERNISHELRSCRVRSTRNRADRLERCEGFIRKKVQSSGNKLRVYFRNLPKELLTSEDRTAKLSPSYPFNLKVLIPSTLPDRESRGPPLLPGLIVASNWM